MYFNISSNGFEIQGMEIELSERISNSIHAKFGYLVTGKSKLSDLNTFSYSSDYISKFQYYINKWRAHISLYYKYTGKKFYYAGDFTSENKLENIREFYIDPYHNLDITLVKKWMRPQLTLSTGVKNIGNVKNIFSTGSPGVHGGGEGYMPAGWGRTYFVKLSYIFKK